jgi:hypothetical protein
MYIFKKKNKIFPIIFNKNNIKFNTNECSICISKFDNNRINLPCGHNFHSNCILNWFEKDMSCPICRLKIKFKKKK